tara:strand:- start:1564 stop:3888 length:2325 start_codon:yes stop_codon:yes gene_type:complete
MKNKLIFFFLFLIFSNYSLAEENKSLHPFCKNGNNLSNSINFEDKQIKNIEVKINKYRQWTENGIRIITGNFRWIPDRYKKRFKGNVIVNYENQLQCNFTARIRHNGDQKDHIQLKDNSLIQSLDVHLDKGHIHGVTKFKLLLSHTRGKVEDEIFITTLLRRFDYLSPRTILVDANVNNVKAKMIFQEKAAKELLENSLRREGPIFEGDERFMFRLSEDLPDNNLSNWEVGMVPLLESGVKAMMAKQINSKLVERTKNHERISYNALSNLNLIYLLYSNMFKNEKNNFIYSDYTLSNNLLGFNKKENILKLDIYNLLMNSANANHGLAPNNRKYYWNSFSNYFEPINYDSNADIDSDNPTFHLPVGSEINEAFLKLEQMLKAVDIKSLNNEIKFRGINQDISVTEKKIQNLISNLKKIKKLYLDYDKEILAFNEKNEVNNLMWENYVKSVKKIDSEIKLIKQLSDNSFESCDYLSNCKKQSLSGKQVTSMLEGELKIEGLDYQYLGKTIKENNLIDNLKYNLITFENSNFYFEDNISYEYDKVKKEFNIYQNELGARAFFINGNLEDITINFFGNFNKEELKKTPKNFPIDINSLTACLSLIDINLSNVVLNAYDSSCEDSINLINASGNIKEVNIKDSFLDGLDIDFSNIEIFLANIDNAKNDCLDVSAGEYEFKNLNLKNCGDKGVSVGEKSIVLIDRARIGDTNIGIASKDSSVTKLNNLSLKNLKVCVSAYNKKQEFSGGFLKINSFECQNYTTMLDNDNYSKISIEKKL